jgi:uncharacterized protein YndB with AHSA1/START domain
MQGRIEKRIQLNAAPAGVWQALSDAREFGQWFRAEVSGELREGAVVGCRSLYPGTEHMRWEMRILALEEGRRIVWEWPAFDPVAFPGDPAVDAKLRVEILLEPVEGGMLLTPIESGFAALPAGPGLAVWQRNEGGWTMQLDNIVAHVSH